MNVERYDWEDALIEAETRGLLEPGAVNMCLRLAKAIMWRPKDGRPSGLYWKNEDALRSVKSSKATYHRYRDRLFELRFFIEDKGNLIPQVPDLSQIDTSESRIETCHEPEIEPSESRIETDESHIETTLSQIETGESQIDSPYSVDTYTGDEYSGDSVSDTAPVVADAPTVPVSILAESKGDSVSPLPEDARFSLSEPTAVFEVEDNPESQSETEFPPDPIPTNAATPSPYEMELAARRREWARMERDTETSSWDQAKRWDRAKRRHKEEMAIRERHGVVPTDEW